MPIEFSVAAFRLGHSMIRNVYQWNARFNSDTDTPGTLVLLFEFSEGSGQFNGELRLPSNWIADFRRLYDFAEANRPGLVVPANQFNRAMRIDSRLADSLRDLPGFPPPRTISRFATSPGRRWSTWPRASRWPRS